MQNHCSDNVEHNSEDQTSLTNRLYPVLFPDAMFHINYFSGFINGLYIIDLSVNKVIMYHGPSDLLQTTFDFEAWISEIRFYLYLNEREERVLFYVIAKGNAPSNRRTIRWGPWGTNFTVPWEPQKPWWWDKFLMQHYIDLNFFVFIPAWYTYWCQYRKLVKKIKIICSTTYA